MKTVTFTPKEAAVIRHRMEVPDAMAEVFGEEGDGNPWGLTDASEIADKLCQVMSAMFEDLPRGGLRLNFDPENNDQALVLREIIEGNVMGSIAQDLASYDSREPEYRKGMAWLAAIDSVENKVASVGCDAVMI